MLKFKLILVSVLTVLLLSVMAGPVLADPPPERQPVCHKFFNGKPLKTINVSHDAVQAHLDHGDKLGVCP